MPNFYLMRGRDTVCAPALQPAWVYWSVQDLPDYTAAQCPVGAMICGANPTVDLADITIAERYVLDYSWPTARVIHVGKDPRMHPTVQAGVSAAAALNPAPSAGNRAIVKIHPGYYSMNATVDVPSWVEIQGTSRRAVQLYNATTNMFRAAGGSVWFRNFLIEGAANNAIYAFDGNDQTGISISSVDMLNNAGTSTQKYLKNSGGNWKTLFLFDVVIDSYAPSGYMIFLENTSGTVRIADAHLWELFIDTLHLTNYGGAILTRDLSDVTVRGSSEIRGEATYNTGVRIERLGGSAGTASAKIEHVYLSGGVAVYGTANSDYLLVNTDAIGATTAGTRTLRNSSV